MQRTDKELKLELSCLGNKAEVTLMPGTTQRESREVKEGESTAKRSPGSRFPGPCGDSEGRKKKKSKLDETDTWL